MVHEFIEKIIIYAPKYLDGKRVQLMDIYYNCVDAIREHSTEEMEETFQEHIQKRASENKDGIADSHTV